MVIGLSLSFSLYLSLSLSLSLFFISSVLPIFPIFPISLIYYSFFFFFDFANCVFFGKEKKENKLISKPVVFIDVTFAVLVIVTITVIMVIVSVVVVVDVDVIVDVITEKRLLLFLFSSLQTLDYTIVGRNLSFRQYICYTKSKFIISKEYIHIFIYTYIIFFSCRENYTGKRLYPAQALFLGGEIFTFVQHPTPTFHTN